MLRISMDGRVSPAMTETRLTTTPPPPDGGIRNFVEALRVHHVGLAHQDGVATSFSVRPSPPRVASRAR